MLTFEECLCQTMEEKEAVQKYPDGNIEVCSGKYKLVYREISSRLNERALILVAMFFDEESEPPKMERPQRAVTPEDKVKKPLKKNREENSQANHSSLEKASRA